MQDTLFTSQVVDHYLTARKLDGYSPTTLSSYQLQLDRFVSRLGDPLISSVTLDDLRGFAAGFPHLKVTTRALIIRIIRAFFKWAYEEDIIERNPSVRLREPKLPDRIPKALSMSGLERLRDACRTVRDRALLEVFFSTGARLAELTSMNHESIEWARNSIIVNGKGNKEREVYLGAKAVIRLEKYLAGRDDREAALFVTERNYPLPGGGRGPRRLSKAQVGRVIKGIAVRCGMGDRVSPHVLRHTLATTLLNQGAPITTVQALLGHKKPETTMGYTRLSGVARQRDFERYFVQ